MKDINVPYKIETVNMVDGNLKFEKNVRHLNQFVVNDDHIFQRIKFFSDDLIIIEEVAQGAQILRCSHELVKVNDNQYVVKNS